MSAEIKKCFCIKTKQFSIPCWEHCTEEEKQLRMQRVRDRIERQENELKKTLHKIYPEHSDHTFSEEKRSYFDAMFMGMECLCSCGVTLKLDRNDFED